MALFGNKVLDKYHAYGGYHWRWYGRKLTYTRHVDFLKRWVKEHNTLDVAAGDGLIAAKLGIRGVESDPNAIKLAYIRGVKLDYTKYGYLPYKKEEFDSALIADSIPSFKNLSQAFRETRRVIKKYLYIATGIGPKVKTSVLKTPQKLVKEVQRNGFKLVGVPVYKADRNRYYFKFEKV